MKQEVAKIWVNALRSGKYKQGRQYLKQGEGNTATHCCLGVLCELYHADRKRKKKKSIKITKDDKFTVFGGLRGVLCNEVKEWAGLSDSTGGFTGSSIQTKNGYHSSLASLNDDAGFDFKQIATVIEKLQDKI